MFSASTIGVSRFPNNATVRVLRTETESKRLLLQSISNQSGSFSFRNSQCETGCNGNRTSEVFLQTPWFAIYLEVSFLKYKFMTLKTSECRSLLDKGVIVSPSRMISFLYSRMHFLASAPGYCKVHPHSNQSQRCIHVVVIFQMTFIQIVRICQLAYLRVASCHLWEKVQKNIIPNKYGDLKWSKLFKFKNGFASYSKKMQIQVALAVNAFDTDP